jgi:positive regulator of sigma E activity
MASSSNRLIGIDVSYVIALIGSVLYGYTYTIGDLVQNSLTHTKFNLFFDVFPALFFFLNGFTVTLTMRDRRISNRKLLSYSGKRGSVLLITGLLFCGVWPMNIFVASGMMFLVIPFVAQWNNILIRIITLLTVVFGITLLFLDVPAHTTYTLPSLGGGEIYNGLGFLFFNGYYSLLPWVVFFLAGLIFGRTDVRPKGWLPPSSIIALLLIGGAWLVNRYAKVLDTDALLLRRSDLFFMNIRLLFPAFCLYGIGMSIFILNAAIFFFRKLNAPGLLKFVQTISSMKYSVVLFYTLIGVITLTATNVEFFSKRLALILYVVLATVLTFYLPFLWRKKVTEQGPMEYIVKRISGSAKK